jgi:hypothetical protein
VSAGKLKTPGNQSASEVTLDAGATRGLGRVDRVTHSRLEHFRD